ncbi:hypothetical protein HPB48_002580 [Haemaphysalis longicornis]|uniref:Uncharacterized protein n=1 Tax=Haemaphysalis longicornis TaxID=44386 RepID=A0A9J6F6M3_HAELO|nr:hypothetical protein HPB48_002580 [Haemaphysalis longicornis]
MVDWCDIATSSGVLSVHLSLPLLFTQNLLVIFFGHTVPVIKASTMGINAGFLVRTVKEHIRCSLCVEQLKAPRSPRPATAVIFNLDRGGLSYPKFEFLEFLCALERAAQAFAELAISYKIPMALFVKMMLQAALENKLFSHDGSSDSPTRAVVELMLEKFSRLFSQICGGENGQEWQRKKHCEKTRLQKRAESVTTVFTVQVKCRVVNENNSCKECQSEKDCAIPAFIMF